MPKTPAPVKSVLRFLRAWGPVGLALLLYVGGSLLLGQIVKHSGLPVYVGLPCQIITTVAMFTVYMRELNRLAAKRKAALR